MGHKHKPSPSVAGINKAASTISFITVTARGGDVFKDPTTLVVSGNSVQDSENDTLTFKAAIVPGTATSNQVLLKLQAPARTAPAEVAAIPTITDGTLTITLQDSANSYLVADFPVTYIDSDTSPIP